MLADFYESQIYPSREEMASLANEAGLPYKIVKTWSVVILLPSAQILTSLIP
jgi:hypothetical protein